MKSIFHKASDRGTADHGWLKTNFSFSFGNYYDPKNTHFGLLRVLNDDFIDAGMGFGAHPHDNMEIVTIPMEGVLEHKDNTGTHATIEPGEVQIMSAGTGIVHSEFNHSKDKPVKLFQIWVFPKEKNIQPRYDQQKFSNEDQNNKWLTVVSPEKNNGALWINQDAYFSLIQLDNNKEIDYKIYKEGNGVYFFLIEGQAEIGEKILSRRDALGIFETNKILIKALSDLHLLAIEVPMN